MQGTTNRMFYFLLLVLLMLFLFRITRVSFPEVSTGHENVSSRKRQRVHWRIFRPKHRLRFLFRPSILIVGRVPEHHGVIRRSARQHRALLRVIQRPHRAFVTLEPREPLRVPHVPHVDIRVVS